MLLKLVNTLVYGFASHRVQPYGKVKCLVTTGNHTTQAIISTNLFIVDSSRVYSAITRRPTLNVLQVVAFTHHMVLKFPMPAEERVIHENQV